MKMPPLESAEFCDAEYVGAVTRRNFATHAIFLVWVIFCESRVGILAGLGLNLLYYYLGFFHSENSSLLSNPET